MRIAVLTGADVEHRYVANRLSTEFELSGIIVEKGARPGPLRRLKSLLRRFGVVGCIGRAALAVFRRIIRDREERQRALRTVLGDAYCDAFLREDLVCRVASVNGRKSLEQLDQLKPDLILVYGTRVVGEKALSRARELCLNMHTGISPTYRGASCFFWPLYNGEPSMVGATVHECVSVIDGGRVFGTAAARLERADRLHETFGASGDGRGRSLCRGRATHPRRGSQCHRAGPRKGPRVSGCHARLLG